MGLTENFNLGNDTMREPRGLLSYAVAASESIPVTWKLTGNLGGESCKDRTRGPFNEGGVVSSVKATIFLAHQSMTAPSPYPPAIQAMTGFSGPDVRFYATIFSLDLRTPEYDIPVAFVFTNSSAGDRPGRFRSQLYVNGFQFGKHVNHIGPQTSYPVPEGILNYRGDNYIGLSLWNMEDDDGTTVKLDGLELRTSSTPVMSGRGGEVKLSYTLPQDRWSRRDGAY